MEAKFLLAGDRAVSVQLGEEISLEVNWRVRMLFLKLTSDPVMGITEMVPTYAALMVHYQPDKIRFERLKEEIQRRLETMDQDETPRGVVKEIPICYGGELGPDLEDCAKLEQVSEEELIHIHSGQEYYCYMLGFAPGHAYTARFSESFRFKRRESPRLSVPGGSIAVQLNLSNLIPFAQPCGWNIIGATPVAICDYSRKDPFLIHAGEWVRYVPVSLKEYGQIKEAVRKGTYRLKSYEKAVR